MVYEIAAAPDATARAATPPSRAAILFSKTSTFFNPIVESNAIICLLILDSSIVSKSTNIKVPIPDLASDSAT